MSEQNPVAMPATVEEALQLVTDLTVPRDIYLSWLRALAGLPCEYGAHLYVAMKERLYAAMQEAANGTKAGDAAGLDQL